MKNVSIHPLVDTLVVPRSWLLWRELRCTWESCYLYKIFTSSVPLEMPSRIAESYIGSIIFSWNSILFSMWLHRVAFLTVHQGSLFSTLTSTLALVFLTIAVLGVVISHCGFEWHFPDIYHAEHHFMYLFGKLRNLKRKDLKTKKSQEIQVKDNGMENQSLVW